MSRTRIEILEGETKILEREIIFWRGLLEKIKKVNGFKDLFEVTNNGNSRVLQ